jgi:tetratricopeptide (TPR) repeat protein
MKLRRLFVATLLAACISGAAIACLNTYGQLRMGHGLRVDMIDPETLDGLLTHSKTLDSYELAWIRKTSDTARKQPTYEHRSDLGVALVHLGKYRQAVGLLEDLEKQTPGRYQTAANLGTAYELAGDPENALKWIREGIRRNPKAHEGTEWLHAAILDAKLHRRAAGTRERSLLVLDFGDGRLPQLPQQMPNGNDGKPVSVRGLGMALRYQLIERAHFVPAPDPTVAALLADWGHLELVAGDVYTAAVVYEAALRYGYPRTPMLAAGLAEARRQHSSAELEAREKRCQLCYTEAAD